MGLSLAILLPAKQQQAANEAIAQKAVEAERRGDFADAVSAFQQLISNGADSPELRSNLGIAYFQLHEYGEALRQFRLVLTKDPRSTPGNLFSGLCLLKLERPKEALTFLKKVHQIQPADPEVLVALAQAEVATNNLSEAQSFFQEATRLDTQKAEAWYGLGITDRALSEQRLKVSGGSERQESRALMDAANAAISRGMQLDPEAIDAYMILGESFRIAERYDEAVEEYKTATERKPDFAPAWAGLAEAYSAAGNDERALEAARRALTLDAHDAATNVLIAATYLRQSDYEKAKQFATHALELRPDLSSGHVVLAKVDLEEHEPAKALPELRAAVKDDLDGSTYYLLATTLRQLGKQNEAATAMQKYKQLHAVHVRPEAGTP